MLTLPYIRENKERILAGLETRNYPQDIKASLDQIIDLDDRRKANQAERDDSLSQVNRLSKEIGTLYQSGQREKADEMKAQVADIKEQAKSLEAQQQDIQGQLDDLLLSIPNVPHPSVPSGSSEDDNEVVRPWKEDVTSLKGGLPHWELATKYGLIDFETGTKITGAGFPLFRGQGARLERALINFFLDSASSAGYEEVIPPLVVNADSAKATGQLPDKEGQMYYVERDDLYLIPTAEVPVTNIYRNVIISESDFPIKLTGYTPCFRREAGSYGADVKGLNRVHQFDKVEIVQITHPDKSYETLDDMVSYVGGLLDQLELPYRILRLCGGDLGFTSALTYDFEVYSAGQGRWLEVSSVSNFETFQANRLRLRYKDADGKKHLAHTLNGSALALARIVAAILENNQVEDGIMVPKVLQDYMKSEKIT